MYNSPPPFLNNPSTTKPPNPPFQSTTTSVNTTSSSILQPIIYFLLLLIAAGLCCYLLYQNKRKKSKQARKTAAARKTVVAAAATLISACKNGSFDKQEVALELLKRPNIDVSTVETTSGNQALGFACMNVMDKVVSELIEKDPQSVHHRNKDGKTPLMILCESIVPPNTSESDEECFIQNRETIIESLIKMDNHGDVINAKTNDGKTALHLLYSKANSDRDNGQDELSVFLIKNGANVDEKDNAGNTPRDYRYNLEPNLFPTDAFIIHWRR